MHAMTRAGRECLGVTPYTKAEAELGTDLRIGCSGSDEEVGGDAGVTDEVDGITLSQDALRPKIAGLATYPGYCGFTNFMGDRRQRELACLVGTKGSFQLTAPTFETGLAECAAICRSCARCKYVSYTLKQTDCSWFHSCDLTSLHDAPTFAADFMTVQVNANDKAAPTSLEADGRLVVR
mgnify:CR=1 FL=1|jgi:hypothetical protein